MKKEQFLTAIQGSDFENLLLSGKTILLNNNTVPLAYWYLIIAKSDLMLFCGGIRPNRYWSFNATKKFFGLKGNKEKCLMVLDQYVDFLRYN